MTVYGQSDIDTVTISGAGHSHVRTKNETYISVSCVVCEPELIKMGWVNNIRNVPLTYDEQQDAELAGKDIARFEQLKVAESAREAAAAVRGGAKTTARRGSASQKMRSLL